MTSDTVMKRTLGKQIYMWCNARNPQKAKQCRKCGYEHLRSKSKKRCTA